MSHTVVMCVTGHVTQLHFSDFEGERLDKKKKSLKTSKKINNSHIESGAVVEVLHVLLVSSSMDPLNRQLVFAFVTSQRVRTPVDPSRQE